MNFESFLGVIILLSQQLKPTISHEYSPRDEYTAGRKYYKQWLGLTSVPTDIPADALEIYIRHNTISRIRANAFSQLSQCRKLSLHQNKISEVESGVFNELKALTYLTLGSNNIQRLHQNMFNGLKMLADLRVYDNKISDIEIGTFNGLTSLVSLTLGDNRLQRLQTNMFSSLTNLTYLRLYGNRISEIEPGSFNGLSKLEHLDLKSNKLDELHLGTFCGLYSLRELYLEDNRMKTLPAAIFDHLPHPLQLRLHDHVDHQTPVNPLQCDTNLCWLKLEEHQVTIIWDKSISKTRCTDEIDWDLWICKEGGIIFSFFIHLFIVNNSGAKLIAYMFCKSNFFDNFRYRSTDTCLIA